MCDNLLKSLLNDDLHVEIVILWLKNEHLNEESFEKISSFGCSQAEFVLFYLNYLHEQTSGMLQSISTQMTPNKIKTPVRVGSFVKKSDSQNNFNSKNNTSNSKSASRRTSLFSEKQNKTHNNSCLGVSALENESKHLNYSFQSTSTPRSNKSRSSNERLSFLQDFDNSFSDSLKQMSPISPVCRTRNSLDFKNKSPKLFNRVENTSNFCLGDFIVKKTCNNKQKKHKSMNSSGDTDDSFQKSNNKLIDRSSFKDENNFVNNLNSTPNEKTKLKSSGRRINPTNLSQDDKITSKRIPPNDSKNSFSFQEVSETDESLHNNSRDILRKERLKILSRSTLSESGSISNILPVRSARSNISIIQPSLESVTFKSQLDILAQIYSLLIDLNLVLNILSEIYFLISLILIQFDADNHKNSNTEIEDLRTSLQNSLTDFGDESFHNINNELFKSVHNCVYFAANVLSRQYHLLSALDRASLKLLQENVRLNMFAPDLSKQLVIYHGKKVEKKTVIYTKSVEENVAFNSDTDNRENFSSESSFQIFRKQRDLFYELLGVWKMNHLQSNWNFSTALTNKIRMLMTMHSDPINLMHLARLFKNQLLAESSQISETTPLPSCLNILPNVNAEKLSLLTNRLVSKKSTGELNPEPSFPGDQEFFKMFIIYCSSPKFHKHLIDCFSADIVQLDDTMAWPLDVEDTSDVVDPAIKILYLNSLKSLKILAKFLGLLDAFAYQPGNIPNHQILTSQLSIRKQFNPSVNVMKSINEAVNNGKLTLTIPWVIEYLAMLDHVTLRLPYFLQLIETLFDIHYNTEKYLNFTMNLEPILMIKLCLGWLFERPNFPLESYQNWIAKIYLQNFSINELSSINHNNEISNGNCSDYKVDCLDIVDETILFICCPYLYEIRNFLSSDLNSNFNNYGSVKYIRPISTFGENSDLSKKRLQKQLEEAFYLAQSASTKKTIELVAERVASVCVKYICNNLVPETKIKNLETFKKHLEHIAHLCSISEIEKQISTCCIKEAKLLSSTCFQEFQMLSKIEIANCTKMRCENSLTALLADDVNSTTKFTCISIAIAKSTEKIEQWYNSHVKPDIFLKEFLSEMENLKQQNAGYTSKKISYKIPLKGRRIEHNPDADSPTIVLINSWVLLDKINKKPHEVELEELNKLIEDVTFSYRSRCDSNQVAQFVTCRHLFDMFFLLCAKRPDIAANPIFIDNLIQFWSSFLHKDERKQFFDRIFCPRNACMFEHSTDEKTTWLACQKLIIELFHKDLLTLDQFVKQTIAMFRYEWNSNTIKHFTQCLQNIVDDYVKRNGSQESFTFIINWIADYCNDDEFF